jgi:hypothetical protein
MRIFFAYLNFLQVVATRRASAVVPTRCHPRGLKAVTFANALLAMAQTQRAQMAATCVPLVRVAAFGLAQHSLTVV